MTSLSADESRLLVKVGSHPEELTCLIRGLRLTAATVLDEQRTIMLHGGGGAGWWLDTDGAVSEVDTVEDFEMLGTLSSMPDELWSTYTGRLLAWLADATALTWLATRNRSLLHDGRRTVPLPTNPYPTPAGR